MCPLVFPSAEEPSNPNESTLNLLPHERNSTTRRSKSPTSIPSHDTSNVGRISDRAELIERIKAGENPTWVSNRTDDYYEDINEKISSDENDHPKSALHSGVFADDETNRHHVGSPPPTFAFRNTCPPPNPYLPHPPSRLELDRNVATDSFSSKRHYRLPSLSATSNFVFKPPTSPLVHSSNPDLMDIESTSPFTTRPIDIGTRAPPTLQSTLSSPQLSLSPCAMPTPSLPRYSTFSSLSYKRRSMTDTCNAFTPERRHSRRLSSGFSHGSELPHGSFVGSFEESILNGRMSTTPSKPLNFVAQIGVLGLGKCKPSLRCPTHLMVTFPAYFYSVGDYDSPSPYVGQVDLEAALAEKSGKKFPGYRIPEKGQLQIVIKNPNKSAVKLFLVPYDIHDMEPGTKTFVRQKSYALNNSVLADALTNSQRARNISHEKDRESLRYLIHLHICCPSKGRYYLHRIIRVVFANRVPDGKEKLRNEILVPDPKYSPWKPKKPEPSGKTGGATIGRRSSMMEIVNEFERPTDSPGKPVPPIPALPPQFAIWQNPGKSTATSAISNSYDKIDASVYPTTPRAEVQSLLARKLKSLEVDGFVDPKPRNNGDSLLSPEERP